MDVSLVETFFYDDTQVSVCVCVCVFVCDGWVCVCGGDEETMHAVVLIT